MISVDWRRLADTAPFYNVAAANSKPVGYLAADLVNFLVNSIQLNWRAREGNINDVNKFESCPITHGSSCGPHTPKTLFSTIFIFIYGMGYLAR